MNQKEIYNHLLDRDFDERTSEILAENLVNLTWDLHPLLEKWLSTGIETDFESNDMSIRRLMSDYDMQYQAALLTMDWILKEPEIALEVIKKGIR